MSRADVAALAGVPLTDVQPATAAATVVDVATQEAAAYWRVGARSYLDDPYFGPVMAIDDQRYSSEIGLYDVRAFGEDV